MSDEQNKNHEPIQWQVAVNLEKYDGDVSQDQINDPNFKPVEVIDREGNLLVIGGASALWQRLIGTGVTAFDNSNAYLSVGDSTTAAADTQTELQAGTNRVRKAMDSTYPQHTDSTSSSGAKSITFRSTYGTTDANFAWQEWGIFNSAGTGGPPTTGGRMLNRKVESLGTKTSSATWVLTVTISLA